MKKLLIIISIFILTTNINAQTKAFEKGDVTLSPGIGLGVYGIGYGVGVAIPFVLNFDIGIHDYVSVGAYGGFWTRKKNFDFNDNYRFTSTHFGARASFHFWQLIDDKVNADLKGNKLDIYFTPWIGYNIRTTKWIDNGGTNTGNFGWGNRFQGGAQLGILYFVNQHIGFFGEWGGTPTAYSNIGLTIKF